MNQWTLLAALWDLKRCGKLRNQFDWAGTGGRDAMIRLLATLAIIAALFVVLQMAGTLRPPAG